MQLGSQNNAMAEIALALAMGFFSIMVLTMVSMGSGFATKPQETTVSTDQLTVKSSQAPENQSPAAARTKTVPRDSIVIYYQEKFYDADLKVIEAHELKQRKNLVLALDPSISMQRAIKIRTSVPREDVTITTLNGNWLKALKENLK